MLTVWRLPLGELMLYAPFIIEGSTSMFPIGVLFAGAKRRGSTAAASENAQAAKKARKQPERAESSLIDDTLDGGFRWLRFPKALEKRFTEDTASARLATLMIAGTLVVFMLSLMLITDHAMVPDVFDMALILRLWVFAPMCLAGLWLISRIESVLYRELMAVSADLSAGLLHLFLCGMSRSEHALAYTTGLAMIILYSNVYVRMRFWVAVPTCVALLLMYLASLWFLPNPLLALSVPIGMMLLSTAVFTLYYLYTLEHEERESYLLAQRQRLLQGKLTHANHQLERVSRVDALTQVANRRHFDTFLAQLWERARRDDSEVSIVMLDVDHFKAYNDQYGHPAGDECLVQVARSVCNSLRRPGDLVARYGGEEFVGVLRTASPAQAHAAAERVRQAVQSLSLPHCASPVEPMVTVSVGVATMRPSDHRASPQRLIQLADDALYQAKIQGRNRVWADHHASSPSRCDVLLPITASV